jgi:hypothetical protein
MSQGDRVYGEEEVNALLKRALELQTAEGHQPVTGLSLEEIREIAARVGIEPRYLLAAAADFDRIEPEQKKRYLVGGPSAVDASRVINGEIGEEEWGVIVDELQRTFGELGRTDRHGRNRTWGGSDRSLVEIQAAAQAKDGVTAIRLTQRFDGMVGLSVGTGGILSLLAAFVFVAANDLPLLLELAIAGGGLSGIAVLFRSFYGRFTRRQRAKLSALLGRIEGILQETPRGESERVERAIPARAEDVGTSESYEEAPRPVRPVRGTQ